MRLKSVLNSKFGIHSPFLWPCFFLLSHCEIPVVKVSSSWFFSQFRVNRYFPIRFHPSKRKHGNLFDINRWRSIKVDMHTIIFQLVCTCLKMVNNMKFYPHRNHGDLHSPNPLNGSNPFWTWVGGGGGGNQVSAQPKVTMVWGLSGARQGPGRFRILDSLWMQSDAYLLNLISWKIVKWH